MKDGEVLQMKLESLDELYVGDWIEKAKAIIARVEDRFGYQVKTVSVTVSANPSATVTFEPKP